MTSNGIVRSHGPSAHGDTCPCDRCVGYQPGNTAAKKRGAWVSEARLLRDPRVAEIAAETRSSMPWYMPADEPTVLLFSCTLTRVERAYAAIERVDAATAQPLSEYVSERAPQLAELRRDLRGWIRLAASLANDLGLSPRSRLAMGVDAVHGEVLRRQLVARYGGST